MEDPEYCPSSMDDEVTSSALWKTEIRKCNAHTHLMPLECSYPVPCLSISQHGLAILACAGEKVTIWCDWAAG